MSEFGARSGDRKGVGALVGGELSGGTNDFQNTYTYDKLGRMTSVDQQGQSGGNTVTRKLVDFGYDMDSRLASISRKVDVAGGDMQVEADTEYTLDCASRLTDLVHSGGDGTFSGAFCVEIDIALSGEDEVDIGNAVQSWWLDVWMPHNETWVRVWNKGRATERSQVLLFEDEFLGAPKIVHCDGSRLRFRLFGKASAKFWRDWLVSRVLPDLRARFPAAGEIISIRDSADDGGEMGSRLEEARRNLGSRRSRRSRPRWWPRSQAARLSFIGSSWPQRVLYHLRVLSTATANPTCTRAKARPFQRA